MLAAGARALTNHRALLNVSMRFGGRRCGEADNRRVDAAQTRSSISAELDWWF